MTHVQKYWYVCIYTELGESFPPIQNILHILFKIYGHLKNNIIFYMILELFNDFGNVG